MRLIKYLNTSKNKTWKVTCRGKTISKHIDFWHAQDSIERLYKQGKIDNTYRIEPMTWTVKTLGGDKKWDGLNFLRDNIKTL